MTEKEMLCVRALRICHSNEDCRDCEFMESDRDEKSCVNILFEDAAEIIESLSKRLESAQPKWISVEERLPLEDETVIVCADDGCVYAAQYWGHGKWRRELIGCCRGDTDVTPTHWMPLPNSP